MPMRMNVGVAEYVLSAQTDVPALEVEICDAMRRGSGIVSVDMHDGHQVTLILSPGVPVSFEEVQNRVDDDWAQMQGIPAHSVLAFDFDLD